MYIDYGSYFLIEEFKKNGIGTIFTEKNYGDIKEMLVTSQIREKNIKDFLKRFSLGDKKIVISKQTHSKNVVDIKEDSPLYFEDVDGFITSRRDIVLFTLHADCLPIYFYDRDKKIIGLCHSGWKGSYLEIAGEVLQKMKKNYGSMEKDILIGLGIGAGGCCYQVGEDFYLDFKNKFPTEVIEASFKRKNGSWYFDNLEFNYLMLVRKGVLEGNIIKGEECTVCNDRFHSYRREGKDAGRNGAFIFFEG